MSQETTQQATRNREEKSVATKEFSVVTEIAKDSKKTCRDRVDRLKRKMFVVTRKLCHDRFQKQKDMRSWLQIG